MKILISILLLTACALYLARADESRTNQSTGSTSPPTLPHASVELPWNEFRTLWESAQAAKPPAPLTPEYAIVESRFILDWNADPTQIAASWIVDNFASEPRWVTLLPPDAILGPQNEDDAPAAIARQAGGIAFLLPQKGRTTFRALLLGTRESSPQGREVIRFPTGSPGITVVEIRNLPEDLEVGIPGGTAMRRNSAVATFVLPANTTAASVVIKSTAEPQEAVCAKNLPLAEPANLVISRMNAVTRIVKDGAVLTEIEASVRADAPGRWIVSLPAETELLRCTARGETIRPVRRGESLEIPILPSANEKEIKIHLSYTGKLNPLDPVAGGVILSLPETAEFIDSVEWQLHFPSEFRVAGLESLAEILPTEPGQPLRLRQQLVRGSKIQAGIFYRKHGIE